MGLSFGALVNAALGGAAAYQTGKRQGQQSKLERELAEEQRRQNEELRKSQLAENAAQARAADALARQRQWEIDHPEVKTANVPEHQAYATYYDSLIAQGKTPNQADQEARRRFGKNQERPAGPVYGSDEYLRAVDRVESVRDRHQGSRDTGEAGSEKDLRDKREFFQARISYWSTNGRSPQEASELAQAEWNAAAKATGPFSDVSGGYGGMAPAKPTAKLLAQTIPTGSANAGKRGVKPTVTSSTEKANPTRANSPKASVKRPTDADVDRAIDAVGTDPAKIRAWLSKKGFYTDD